MARTFTKPNVGASGRRRIVPMMGIDFIAGQIERKGSPIASRGSNIKPYGQKPPSIGGRTRSWSFVNFLNVDANMGRSTEVSAEELQIRGNFRIGVLSANTTLKDLAILAQVQADFVNNTIYNRDSALAPSNYATVRGWLTAIRLAQLGAGVPITTTYTTWPPVFEA